MREKQRIQRSIFYNYSEHEIGAELHAISKLLDNHSELLDLLEKV